MKIFLLLTLVAMFSCTNETCELDVSEHQIKSSIETLKASKTIANLVTELQSVESIHHSVSDYINLGLDEILPLSDVITDGNILSRSTNDDNSFELDGLQIYWPYSEDWDGKSLPVISYLPSDDDYIDGDKIMAYKLGIYNENVAIVDSLLINEEYAMLNPVWIINKSDLSNEDLINVKAGLPTSDGIYYSPLTAELPSTRAVSSGVTEVTISKMRVTHQHDSWVSGGSEFDMYWFFPTSSFGLSYHKCRKTFSRKDISKKRTKILNLLLNTDWSDRQADNRLKVWETDGGSSENYTVSLNTSYTSGQTTMKGEFKETIKIKNHDDNIMDWTIARNSMFLSSYKISEGLYERTFIDNGVEITIRLTERK